MRLNEALALQWVDLNFEGKTLSIVRAIEPTKKHEGSVRLKGGCAITIDDALMEI
jgi:integrase